MKVRFSMAGPSREISGTTLARLLCALLLSASVCSTHAADTGLFDVDLDELMNINISSASRFDEPLRDAPATVIVLTQNDLRTRGYRELSEIYNDLPGMELSRAYGDTWYRNQWRGLRKSIGTPYLLMLDGVLMNHLWFNQEEIIAALPITMIDRVEIVYGPASVLYGANAFVGAINVLTRRDTGTADHSETIRLSRGANNSEIIDLHWLQKLGQMTLSLAARYDYGETDSRNNDRYEYLKDHYFTDRNLWGPFVDYKDYGDDYSPHKNGGIDLRLYYQDFEIAAQYFVLDTGFGNVYPGDRILNYSRWIEPEVSVYGRHKAQVAENLSATTLLRYRESGVDPDSTTLEGYNVDNNTRRVVDFSYWGSRSSSIALHEDLSWVVSERLNIGSGLRFERKRLQRAYDITWGSSTEIDPCDEFEEQFPDCLSGLEDYDFPTPPGGEVIINNHIVTTDRSLYALARYKFGGEDWHGHELALHLGGRYDDNSEVGSAPTKRMGAVYRYESWSAKLLYGESFNEPAGRELYGGWQGSGSAPDLQPETAETVSLSLSYQARNWQMLAEVYDLHSDANIITFAGGATNLGDRDVQGLDAHAQWQREFGDQQLKLWAYWTHLFSAQESTPYQLDPACSTDTCAIGFRSQDIGDNASNKFWLGATWSYGAHLSVNLRGRHIGARPTVATNPEQAVDAYTALDLNLQWRDFLLPHFDVSLAITNLTDTEYDHPGLREGNAGSRVGQFDSNGVWQGSEGWYSSLLPQPGRELSLSVAWRY